MKMSATHEMSVTMYPALIERLFALEVKSEVSAYESRLQYALQVFSGFDTQLATNEKAQTTLSEISNMLSHQRHPFVYITDAH